jgi:hypothetical protein
LHLDSIQVLPVVCLLWEVQFMTTWPSLHLPGTFSVIPFTSMKTAFCRITLNVGLPRDSSWLGPGSWTWGKNVTECCGLLTAPDQVAPDVNLFHDLWY